MPAAFQNANGFIGKVGTTVYLSFLFRKNANTAGWYDQGPLVQLIKYSGLAGYGSEPNKLGVGVLGNNTNFQIASGGSTVFTSSTPFVLGQTYFIVMKCTFNASTTDISVFINPDVNAPEPSPTITHTTNFNYEFDAVYFSLGEGNNQGNIDELRVGGTWDDVTPSLAIVGITSATITGSSTQITTPGGVVTMTATYEPLDATLPVNIKWTSSDITRATVRYKWCSNCYRQWLGYHYRDDFKCCRHRNRHTCN